MYQCPMGAFFYTIQPYDTSWLDQRYPSTIYPITSANAESNPNYICPEYGYYPERYYPAPTRINKTEVYLTNTIRMLWEQHGAWTRMAITSLALDLPDVDLVIERLLRNPVDFENALRPFYGDKIASKFSDLLKSHLVIAAELVKASKVGDNKVASDTEKKWYDNANEIAVFLGRINPYWSQEDWRIMLHKHLALVKAEAVAMLTKNYAAGIAVYDEIENQALEMADVMAEGIIKQFPEIFKE
ncbi:hypothetical protein CPJCM30710_15210 [Clostridium polyendosporum]|uniref:Acetylglutamate kinase n=1 Tax=Clostridium polyendosporum TaxID=69208 RepID=A0A919S0E8_9CLOT|nr:LysM peptidoglycan-binding domain-containing protein [Clostridium polyendosporum]GIM28855.1 hypothetical protein CPJCM30710_15210 [Clostridium polyendosporum]